MTLSLHQTDLHDFKAENFWWWIMNIENSEEHDCELLQSTVSTVASYRLGKCDSAYGRRWHYVLASVRTHTASCTVIAGPCLQEINLPWRTADLWRTCIVKVTNSWGCISTPVCVYVVGLKHTVTSAFYLLLVLLPERMFLRVGWDWVHFVLRPLFGLLYQHRMMMMSVEQSVEWELAGETKVLGENPPHCHFAHNKSHVT
jgi:hypothetical protein